MPAKQIYPLVDAHLAQNDLRLLESAYGKASIRTLSRIDPRNLYQDILSLVCSSLNIPKGDLIHHIVQRYSPSQLEDASMPLMAHNTYSAKPCWIPHYHPTRCTPPLEVSLNPVCQFQFTFFLCGHFSFLGSNAVNLECEMAQLHGQIPNG